LQLSVAILKLGKDPPEGDIIKMKKGPADYRLRSGDYRFFFNIVNNQIIIESIFTRGHAYKNRR